MDRPRVHRCVNFNFKLYLSLILNCDGRLPKERKKGKKKIGKGRKRREKGGFEKEKRE